MNIFTDIEKGLLAAGKFILGIEGKATKVLSAAEKVSPELIAEIDTTLTDVEAFASLAAGAAVADGLNFPADSAAYAALMKVIADVKSLGTSFSEAIAALKAAA